VGRADILRIRRARTVSLRAATDSPPARAVRGGSRC